MATTRYAIQSETQTRQPELSASSIELEWVSVSQLLGRDYVFIDTRQSALPVNNPPLLHALLDDLVAQLELVEAHTVAISVHGVASDQVSFTRHDLTWHKHKICRVESTDITHPEQYEFMDMIWRCSTSAVAA